MTTVRHTHLHLRVEQPVISEQDSTRPEQVRLIKVGDEYAPAAPHDLRGTGLAPSVVSNLALKVACSVPQFTTEWAARRLHLPPSVVGEVLQELRAGNMLETLGASGPFGFRYAVSERGREHAARLMEISGYVGPAPCRSTTTRRLSSGS